MWRQDQSVGGNDEIHGLSLPVRGIKVRHQGISCTALLREDKNLLDAKDNLMTSLPNIRKTRGIRQEVVARRLGATQPALAAFEHFGANPRMSSIRRDALVVGAQFTIEITQVDIDPKYDESELTPPKKTKPPKKTD